MPTPMPGDINLSRQPAQPEMRPVFTHSNNRPAQAEAQEEVKKVTGAGQSVATLPPFPVLLQWLQYYHTQTGTWPEPELFKSPTTEPVQPGADKPFLTLLPDLNPYYDPNTESDKTPKRNTGKKNNNKTQTQTRNVDQDEDVGEEAEEYIFKYAAACNLRASVYYQVALDLIQKQASLTSVKFPLNPKVETILTLASFLAWCRYPSFIAEYNKDDTKMGMYLPLERWSKVLKIRKATLSLCLNELKTAGLVEIHNSSTFPGEVPNKRGNRVYRLAVPLLQPLPIFDPFQNTYKKPGKRELHQEFAEPGLVEFQVMGTENEREPISMNHVSSFKNIKINKSKPINHEHGRPVEPGTVAHKLLFLLETASFPGYTSPDGLITLDKREAQKFAVDSRLDLNSLKRIYHQVLSAWTTGKCTRNPIGFFHYTLTRYIKQNPSPTPFIEVDTTATEGSKTESAPLAGTLNKVSSRFRSASSYLTSKKEGSLDYQTAPATTLATEKLAQSGKSNLDDIGRLPLTPDEEEKIQQVLQEEVVDALKDRFKLPELAARLLRLKWVIRLSNTKFQLQLEKQDTSIWPALALVQSELSLLKIAVSQVLRGLHGYGGVFEVEIIILPHKID